MVIRILDHVKTASSYEDGDVIFKLLLPELQGGRDVVVSFEGIGSVPSSFVNAAFIRLLESVSFATVRRHLKLIQSTRQINALIRSRFEFVAQERDR